jgi:hypothetical protein
MLFSVSLKRISPSGGAPVTFYCPSEGATSGGKDMAKKKKKTETEKASAEETIA